MSSINDNEQYIKFINSYKTEISDLIENNFLGKIDNIEKIISLGDLHADLDILLLFLKQLNIITYEIKEYKQININDYAYYKYHNNTIQLYNDNNYNKNKLLINKRSYFNYQENLDIYNNNLCYEITFNIEQIKSFNKVLFVFLGDITDSHYEKHFMGYKNRRLMYINDIGCYQLLLYLKKLFININETSKISILFGNHEFYELFRVPNDFINVINKYNNNVSLSNLEKLLFPNKGFAINGLTYTLDDKEYVEYTQMITENISFTPNFNNSRIKQILDLKFERRKNIILDNLKNIDFIIIVNNQILLSHTFIFKNPIIQLKKILSKTNNNDNYYLENTKQYDEVKLLNILSKYVLNKLKNNQIQINDNNNDNDINSIIIHLFNILNGRNPDTQIINDKKNKYPSSILCNAENYNNWDENHIKNTSCKNKVHIVGHMPQFDIIRNNKNYLENQNINQTFNYNIQQNYLFKPYFEYKNEFNDYKYIENIISIPYEDFYLYYNDNHLSLSFSDNPNDFEKNIDHYYYLELTFNNNNVYRKLVKFKNQDIIY